MILVKNLKLLELEPQPLRHQCIIERGFGFPSISLSKQSQEIKPYTVKGLL